jgi:hypothetical protein
VVVDIEVVTFIDSYFCVEGHNEWFENGLPSFEIEVHELYPENEMKHRTFGDPVNIN